MTFQGLRKGMQERWCKSFPHLSSKSQPTSKDVKRQETFTRK